MDTFPVQPNVATVEDDGDKESEIDFFLLVKL